MCLWADDSRIDRSARHAKGESTWGYPPGHGRRLNSKTRARRGVPGIFLPRAAPALVFYAGQRHLH